MDIHLLDTPRNIHKTQKNINRYYIGFWTNLGSRVGIQATLEKEDISGEFIRASSDTPPDFDKGPTASTLHKISSLQNPYKKYKKKIQYNTLYK